MTTPLYGAAPTTYAGAASINGHQPFSRPVVSRAIARTTLVSAALLGATADALMHDGPGGLGLAIWTSRPALNAFVLFTRAGKTPARETLAWLSAAIVFSLCLAWRNSEALQGFDFLAMLVSLAMAAVSVRDPRAAL